MVTEAPFRLLGRDPVLREGASATMVALPCQTPASAVAEISRPVWGLRAGRLTFEAPRPRLFAPNPGTNTQSSALKLPPAPQC